MGTKLAVKQSVFLPERRYDWSACDNMEIIWKSNYIDSGMNQHIAAIVESGFDKKLETEVDCI